jgi:hypothetical protein
MLGTSNLLGQDVQDHKKIVVLTNGFQYNQNMHNNVLLEMSKLELQQQEGEVNRLYI